MTPPGSAAPPDPLASLIAGHLTYFDRSLRQAVPFGMWPHWTSSQYQTAAGALAVVLRQAVAEVVYEVIESYEEGEPDTPVDVM